MRSNLFIFSAAVLLFGSVLNAQILKPVKWQVKTIKVDDQTYDVVFNASIENGWALYSIEETEEGPLPTVFEFDENAAIELLGGPTEEVDRLISKPEPLFNNVMVKKFHDYAKFVQRIKVNNLPLTITGSVAFMTCNDTQCIPDDWNFEINLSNEGSELIADTPTAFVNDTALNEALYGIQPSDLQLLDSGCEQLYGGGSSLSSEDTSSIWRIFVLGFLGGLLSLLTPCVFPMIPLTVSYFTKKSDHRSSGMAKAALYGFFIVLVYLVFSIPFHLLDSVNPDILNDISTNVVLNVIFFVIFIAFAFSFFGYYELTLPNSWMSKTTRGESIGGVFGIFFMALTLALVSFSCTGPILGSLLAGSLSSDGGAWQLTVGMGGFGLALGLPFALFALFPNMLKALPKSGGWLNTTKVILGFLELALALKFLSNADLVQHWGVLKIELFLVLWILIFTGLALYLLGVIKFPHDGGKPKFNFTRISGIFLAFAFVVYLISGLRVNPETQGYVPLNLLSGLTPPSGYSVFHPNDCPNNLDCFKDLKQGLAYAQSVNKPVLLDFTGYACVNCRKMEEHVWPNSTIDHFLRSDYVLISLYVDDKKPLPEDQQLESNRVGGGTRLLQNYGHKWANFQTHYFQTNSQPYYVLLSPDGKKVLTQPIGYTPDATQFADFLRCGLKTWNTL